MKVALCLSGMLGNENKYGVGQATSDLALKGSDYFSENILQCNDQVDVFCHSWNPEFEDQIRSIYQPKSCLFQPQIDFGKHLDPRQFAIKSRWYSNKVVIAELKKYEQVHEFEYDFVMLTRFDLALLKPIIFERLNKDRFYIMGTDPIHKKSGKHSMPDHSCCDINSDNYEINDLWFIANSKAMKTFSTIYDHLQHLELDSNHRIARRHLKNTGLFEKRDFILQQNVHDFCTAEDGDAPLIRWLQQTDQKQIA